MILGDAGERIADEAHPARREIGEPVEIIEDLAARRIGGERVDREVAPRRILAPIVGEGDVARRPSVATSRRKVVISTGAPPTTPVIVPWQGRWAPP